MAALLGKSKLFLNYTVLQKNLISLKSFKVCRFLTGKKREVEDCVRNVKTGKPRELHVTFFESKFLTQNSSKKAEFVFIEMFRKAID